MALMQFEDKIMDIGYYDRREYYEMYYSFSGFQFYKVDEEFPKLTPQNVRNEIVSAIYDLALSTLSQWEIEGVYHGVN